jgi:hypothetical protein
VDTLARCGEGLCKIVDDRSQCGLASAPLQNFDGNDVGLEYAFRGEQNLAALRFIVRQPHAAW